MATKTDRPAGAATQLIHAGEVDRAAVVPLTTPIYETTTFVFDNAAEVVAYNEGRSAKHLYSRYTNPTVIAAEQKLAALDGATLHLLEDILARFGVTPRFASIEELAHPEALLSAHTRMLWFESPI